MNVTDLDTRKLQIHAYGVNATFIFQASVVNFGNPLEDRVPGESFSYSDHNAVNLQLRLKPTKEAAPRREFSKDSSVDVTVEQAIKVCEETMETIAKSKKLFLLSGGLLFMFLLGSVGFWPNNILCDFLKLVLTAFCFYYLVMGTLWNKIEMNSLKAGLSALKNFSKTQIEIK